jgi:hypothetical protein
VGPAGSFFLLLDYYPRTVVTKFGSNGLSGFPLGSYIKLCPTVAAILDGERTSQIFKEDHLRTFCLPSLVQIGSAVSEEKIFEKVYD